MILSIIKSNFWTYLKGNFLYRVRKVRLRKAITILTSVVIGALLLAGLYTLFENTIFPRLEQEIINIFDYQG